ncbi:LysR family transcriptional regulator [Saccharibacillus sp. CPCC 101409]|uniref:LysR family transcriptional regulator n=1 Tax=Saccharibacillus sp. CPCC 101409 TaxID=3058041 RepID=UPI002673199A|nr:LysR family transcriptional regulator [Saccharibacillus sp. CPCC 101409]MDO3410350.1 LysR family transcriptional regulator [Saccharibacillus sp. CPCC 101409]
MNLHALRLFHEAAAAGGVTRAAENLKISQPAITSQIKKLERELSLTLLRRDGRGVALTEAGRELDRLAARLFAVERQIERFAADYGSGETGSVSIAATYLPAHFLLPGWIAAFKRRHERVELSVATTHSGGALRRLLDLQADLAIYGGLPEPYPDSIRAEELFRDELWFVVSPEHRFANRSVSLAEMMREPFVMRAQGSSTRERLFALCRAHSLPAPSVPLQFSGLPEAIRAVTAGYGANFVSSLVVREYVERGELCRVFVEDVRLENVIAVCTRRGERLNAAAENLLALIREAGGAGGVSRTADSSDGTAPP